MRNRSVSLYLMETLAAVFVIATHGAAGEALALEKSGGLGRRCCEPDADVAISRVAARTYNANPPPVVPPFIDAPQASAR